MSDKRLQARVHLLEEVVRRLMRIVAHNHSAEVADTIDQLGRNWDSELDKGDSNGR